MLKRFVKRLNNKKGFGSIEIVISAMIVIMMVAGLIDMIQITGRLETASQSIGYVSRVVQKQGGVQPNRIPNYQGKYTTSSTLYENIREMMYVNGIGEDDWVIYITANGNTHTLDPETRVPLVDYGNRIHITLRVNFRWNILASMFPGELASTNEASREVLSGYQVRDSGGMSTDLELE